MPWVRIDEEFPRHPKVVKAGPLGMAMHVAALCYCNQYLTDGFVPRAVVVGLLDLSGIGMRQWMGELTGGGEDASWELVVQDLEAAGLWEREQGGWRIHDFHDYQPSREHVLRLREIRKVVGAKGGKAKQKQIAKQPESKSPSRSEAPQPVAAPAEDAGQEGPAAYPPKPGHESGQSAQDRSNLLSNRQTNEEAKSYPVPVPVPPVGDPGVQVIPEAETDGLPTVAASQATRPESQDTIDVFEAWKATLPPGSRPRLTPSRRDAIKAALKRYDRQDVLDAARGWVNDPWPERAQQNDLAQLLHMGSKRKPANILERMRDLHRRGPPQVMGRRTAEMARNARDLHALVENLKGGEIGDGGRVGAADGSAQRELPRPAG